MSKGSAAFSLGFFSPGREHMPRDYRREVLRRLARALAAGDPEELLTTGAMTAAALVSVEDGTAAALRMAAVLEALLLTPEPLPASLGAAIEEGIDSLLELAAGSPSASGVAARLDSLWRELASRLAPGVGPRRVALEAAVVECLATRLGASVTLSELARALGYSPSHASTVIRRVTGMSFSALRQRMRLDRALWLLGRGSPVKEAALQAGFSDPAYFSRVFRRVYGVPPARWQAGGSSVDAEPPTPARASLRP